MDAAHLIYSSANQPGSYDSWDIENLKYLRSLSEVTANGNLGSGNSYKSTSGKSSIRSRSRLSVINLLESLELENDSDEITNRKPVHPVEYSETDSTKTVTLDTCYVLDVVTVRNDSVLANPIPKIRPGHGLSISTALHNISSAGSDGNEYETPVTDSSEGEGNSPMIRNNKNKSGNDDNNDTDTSDTTQRNFFEEEYIDNFNNALELQSESRETSPSSSSKSSIISVPYLFPFPVLGSGRSRSLSTNSCPYCGDQSSSNESRLSMSSIGTNYYKSLSSNYPPMSPNTSPDELDEISMIPTVGGEMTPFMNRSYSTTSSPYYEGPGLQLQNTNAQLNRQGQQLPIVPNAIPFTNSPSNFGIDHQGQLFIDYTPNWDGLDKYIKEIKKSKE